MKKFYRKFQGLLAVVLLAGVAAARAGALPRGMALDQSSSSPEQSSPRNAGEGARATPDSAAPEKTTTEKATPEEGKISRQDAEELFHEVDEILKFASKDSGFPIKHEVKRRLTNRDEVVAYLEKNMREDKSAQRVQRSELVLKKFGLLPRDFKLGSFLVGLLREQIAGFYDPKTKTMNLLDWVQAGQQRPVLAHELTHALQDQSFNLEKWMKDGGDIDKKKEITSADIASDELDETKQAVVEGQAEAAMLDYALAGAGRSLVDSPEVVAALDHDMMEGTPDSVQFRDAPIFLKESLTFPYRYGVEFVVALLKTGGKGKAFAGAFADPPRITRQIMEPQTYLMGEHIEPMPVPNFKEVFKDYDRFDVGAIGEFDVYMLAEQYDSVDMAHRLSPHWRGGYYYSVMPKDHPPAAPLGLMYASRWSDSESAAEFAAVYAKSLARRYEHVHPMAENGDDPLESPNKLDKLDGKHVWRTEEGPVVIEVNGAEVLVMESLDEATQGRVEGGVFAAAAPK
jgi:hypothetical protein